MADGEQNTGSDSAEKAYAAAAEHVAAPVKPDADPALEFPAKTDRAPAVAAEIAVPAELEADLVMKKELPAPRAKAAKPAARKVAPAKNVAPPKAPAAKPAAAAKKVAAKPAARAAKAVKPAAPKAKTSKTMIKPAFKEKTMATKKTKDFKATVKSAASDVKAKAKLALAKGSEVLGDAGTFTKGNVDALVASGKILGNGLQDLGKTYVAEGKSAYATVTADVKDLKAVKSPVELVRLQTSIVRRNIDHAFDLGGKNGEAMIKLAGQAFAPLSARASLMKAMVKKAA